MEREQADLLQHQGQIHDLQDTSRRQKAELQYELQTTTQRQETEQQQLLTDMRKLQYVQEQMHELEATNRQLEAEKQQLLVEVRQLQYNQRQRTQRDQHYHQLRERCLSQEEEIRRWRDCARSLEKELEMIKVRL